jgi:hypothetical protein
MKNKAKKKTLTLKKESVSNLRQIKGGLNVGDINVPLDLLKVMYGTKNTIVKTN